MISEIHISANTGNGWLDTTLTRFGRDSEGYAEPPVIILASSLSAENLNLFSGIVAELVTLANAGGWLLESAIVEPDHAMTLYGPEPEITTPPTPREIIGTRAVYSLACTQRMATDTAKCRTVAISTEEFSATTRDAVIALWSAVSSL